MNINSIPDDVLEICMFYLTIKKDVLSTMLSCKRWLNLIRKTVYRSRSISWAAKCSRWDLVQELLQDARLKVSPLEKNCLIYGHSALYYAVRSKNINIVKILLNDKRTDPSEEESWIIPIAVQNNSPDILKELLKDKRINPCVEKNFAIKNACRNGYLEIFELLINDDRIIPTHASFLCACEENHIEIVKLILKDGRVDPSEYNNRVLHEMCRINQLEIVKELLKDKRVINSKYIDTPLYIAANYGYLDIVKEFLKYKKYDLSTICNAMNNAKGRNCTKVINELINHI